MAACLKLPEPPVPPLPLPFAIPVITTPPIGIDGNLYCCRLPSFALPPIPIKLTADLTGNPTYAAAVLIVQNAVAQVKAYVDMLPNKCPLE